jgi:hypothetical protein
MKPAARLEADREKYQNGYYADKLEQGLQFQDFATRELYKRGIVVVGYASRRWQNEKGENMLGAEIKRDGEFRNTGNLYIEIAEKSHPDKPNYTPSGIMRDDNSWLFVIGDEQTLYIFSTVYLRKLIKARGWRFVQKTTSQAHLMPLEDAERYCIRKIEP